MVQITAIVPTRNEEINIERCLKSLEWCDEILVIDMGTDETDKIAKKMGASVIKKTAVTEDDFVAVQKNINEGIQKARNSWILRVDADEEVTEELRKEIEETLSKKNDIVAYGIPRNQFFLDGFLTGGDWAYDRLVRLFKKGYAHYDEKHAVHEQFIVEGKIGYLKSKLQHYSHPNKLILLKKFESYTTIEAKNLREPALTALLKMFFLPPYIFLRWMIWHNGYRDGLRGLRAAYYRGYYDFLLYKKYVTKRINS